MQTWFVLCRRTRGLGIKSRCATRAENESIRLILKLISKGEIGISRDKWTNRLAGAGDPLRHQFRRHTQRPLILVLSALFVDDLELLFRASK